MNEFQTPHTVVTGHPAPKPAGGESYRPGVVERIDRDIHRLVERLIHLHYDVYAAHRIAGLHAQHADRSALYGWLETEHAQSLRMLQRYSRDRGGDPPRGPDVRAILTKGRVHVGRLHGDAGIARAVDANEHAIEKAYADALTEPGLPEELRELIQQGLDKERGHRVTTMDLTEQE